MASSVQPRGSNAQMLVEFQEIATRYVLGTRDPQLLEQASKKLRELVIGYDAPTRERSEMQGWILSSIERWDPQHMTVRFKILVAPEPYPFIREFWDQAALPELKGEFQQMPAEYRNFSLKLAYAQNIVVEDDLVLCQSQNTNWLNKVLDSFKTFQTVSPEQVMRVLLESNSLRDVPFTLTIQKDWHLSFVRHSTPQVVAETKTLMVRGAQWLNAPRPPLDETYLVYWDGQNIRRLMSPQLSKNPDIMTTIEKVLELAKAPEGKQ